MLMLIYEFFIGILLLIWVLLTILRQLSNCKVQYYDYFDLIPHCYFFTPKPLSKDYRAYAIGLNESNEECGLYKPFYDYKRFNYNIFWNPSQKIAKTINDLSTRIVMNLDTKNYDLAYLIMLNKFNSLFRNELGVSKIKFIIVSYAGYENETHTIIFESKIHRIDRNLQ